MPLCRPEGPSSTFPVESRWKSVPWTKQFKADYESLIDFFADLPALMWSCEDVHTGASIQAPADRRRAFIFDIWNLAYTMRRWWDGGPKRAKQIRLVDTGILSGASGRVNAFPQSYESADCSAAAMNQMYLGGLLYLYTMLNANSLALQGIKATYLAQDPLAGLHCKCCYAAFCEAPNPALNGCHCGCVRRQAVHDLPDLPKTPEEYDFIESAAFICLAMKSCHGNASRFMDSHRAM